MKVSGFTFIRNGQQLGYPFVQSIQSILPLCDEFIVNVGESLDDTLAMIKAIDDPKIKITQTCWNDNVRIHGFTYAQQKMIAQYQCTGEWLFYLEGDEVVHEEDLDAIRLAMEKYHKDERVEALVFDYYHFYGNINTYAWSPAWYRRAPRIIKASVRSYAPDGLYWLASDPKVSNRKLRQPRAALVGAPIYHYGWVRTESQMQEKCKQIGVYWGHDKTVETKNYGDIDTSSLRLYNGKHPRVIEGFFPAEAGLFATNPHHKLTTREKKHRLLVKLEEMFKIKFGRKHYKLVV